MHIQNGNPGSKAITLPQFDGIRVSFSKNGHANVPDAVGRHLVRACPSIEEVVRASSRVSRSRRTKVNEPVEDHAETPVVEDAQDSEASDTETNKAGE